MTVLVFLARAAGASFVAADLAPRRRVLRIALGDRRIALRRYGGRGQRGRHSQLVLARVRVEVMRFHVGKLRRFFLRRLLHDLNEHQLCGNRLAQMRDHRLEQRKGFRFVLIERIALAIAAQADDLAQVIEHHQMLAPEMIESL